MSVKPLPWPSICPGYKSCGGHGTDVHRLACAIAKRRRRFARNGRVFFADGPEFFHAKRKAVFLIYHHGRRFIRDNW